MSRLTLKLKRGEVALILEALESVIDWSLAADGDIVAYVDLEDMLRGHLRAHDLAEAARAS